MLSIALGWHLTKIRPSLHMSQYGFKGLGYRLQGYTRGMVILRDGGLRRCCSRSSGPAHPQAMLCQWQCLLIQVGSFKSTEPTALFFRDRGAFYHEVKLSGAASGVCRGCVWRNSRDPTRTKGHPKSCHLPIQLQRACFDVASSNINMQQCIC